MQPKVVIWGAGGHAKVVADIVRQEGRFTIAGFLDDHQSARRGEAFYGSTILGGRQELDDLAREDVRHVILAFGDGDARLALTADLQRDGFQLVNAIHPRATVAPDVSIGFGTVIAAGAVVNPGASLGQSTIINTSASVDHDCVIADAAHICPGVHLAGDVKVGLAAWVGIGASVIQNIRIGDRAVIGAGAVVVKDIPADVIAFGVPAKVHRNRSNEKP